MIIIINYNISIESIDYFNLKEFGQIVCFDMINQRELIFRLGELSRRNFPRSNDGCLNQFIGVLATNNVLIS